MRMCDTFYPTDGFYYKKFKISYIIIGDLFKLLSSSTIQHTANLVLLESSSQQHPSIAVLYESLLELATGSKQEAATMPLLTQLYE